MRREIWVCIALLLAVSVSCAESPTSSQPAVNVVLVRSAEQLNGPHVITYRVVEWTQIRGRWMLRDVGYYDTGYGNDQIWFAGGGYYVVNKPRVVYYQEFYVSQEAGAESKNARGFWIWPVVETQFKNRFFNQIAAFPTIPLNASQRWGLDIDRAKSEWALNSHWLIGAGYSGGICSSRTWESKPFLTTTRKTHTGNYEFLDPAHSRRSPGPVPISVCARRELTGVRPPTRLVPGERCGCLLNRPVNEVWTVIRPELS